MSVPGRGGPAWRSDRVWQAGFLIGSLVGAAATLAARRAEAHARRGLVDWAAAEEIAIARLASAPGTMTAAELRHSEAAYDRAMARVIPALEHALGTPLPGIVDRHGVVDRATWVRANVATFRDLFGRLERELLDQMLPKGAGVTKSGMIIANRFLSTRQMGYLLGFLGQRVLGQYDVALLSAEAPPGRLLFVEENIRRTASSLGVPLEDFRTWIALHETTHAFEFEAHPWLRPYLAERLERQLVAFGAATVGKDLVRGLGRVVRGEGGGHWIERMMGAEQRRLFQETQAVMSLLEGFGDYVMDTVGATILPDVERISARFHARRERRTGVERAVMRLTGLDLKLEQYRRGEEFVAAVAAAAGAEGLRHLWDGPETLPRPEELDDAQLWLARVGAAGSPSHAAGPDAGAERTS